MKNVSLFSTHSPEHESQMNPSNWGRLNASLKNLNARKISKRNTILSLVEERKNKRRLTYSSPSLLSSLPSPFFDSLSLLFSTSLSFTFEYTFYSLLFYFLLVFSLLAPSLPLHQSFSLSFLYFFLDTSLLSSLPLYSFLFNFVFLSSVRPYFTLL